VGIITLAAAKGQLNIDADDTSQDIELSLFVDGVTSAVEKARGEVIDQRSITDEVQFGCATTSFLLQSAPVISLTTVVAVDGSQTWSTSAMHVHGRSGRVTVLSGSPLTGLVAWTYTAGYTVVPANFQLAALIILQHLWETKRGTMGVQLGGDHETYVPGRGFAIPRRALELLGVALPGVA
jgi:hypothetical protein